jgi:Ca2+-transporting ATPase
MFILAFVGSTAFKIAGTALLIPSQVLWIHMAIVAPIGAVMGLDVGTPGIMRRRPRPFDQPIIVRSMMVRLFVAGLFMAASTLVLVQIGKSHYGSLEVGQTMAVVGLAIMNVFLALNLRFPEDSAFGQATFSNPKLLWAFGWAFVGSMLITQMRVLQDLFHTTPLTGGQWALCLVPGVVLLAGGELFKVVLRARRPAEEPAVAAVPAV